MTSTNVQRSPVNAQDHELEKSADQEAVDILNSALRKPKSPSKSNILVSGFMNLFRGTPVEKGDKQKVLEEGRGHEDVTNREEPGADWIQADANSAETIRTTARPNTIKSPENRRKRKQPPERPDEYEVPVSADALVDGEEERNARPRKQVKRNARSKRPIILPKTSRGRSTRSRQIEEDVAGTDKAKAALDPVNPSRVEVAIPVFDKGTKSPDRSRRSQTPNFKPIGINKPEVDRRDTELFLTPSPQKVVNSASIQNSALATAGTSVTVDKNKSAGLRSLSPDIGDKPVIDENSDISDNDEVEHEIFDIQRLESMLENSKRVGSSYIRTEGRWEKRETETEVSTKLGKRMMKDLESLLSNYSLLREPKGSSTSQSVSETQSKITGVLEGIKRDANEVLRTKLGNPSEGIADFDDKSTIIILTDLYFHIIPSLLDTVKAASEVHTLQTSTETAALQELFDLVNMLHQLAEAARKQPIQPVPTAEKGKRAKSYQIVQPTRRIIKDLRDFRRALSAELNRRKNAEASKEKENIKMEREKARRKEKQKEEIEKRQLVKHIHKSQSQSMMEQLADPIWGEVLRASIIEEEAKLPHSSDTALISRSKMRIQRIGYSRSREIIYNSQRPPKSRSASDRGLVHDNSDDYQRVSVFEKNNGGRHEPRAWSDEEKTRFIEFIRIEKGQDRYERLAEMLEHSMEEIFACAKDLQEAMDHAHENGKLNKVCDEWTYAVWVEPKQP